MNRNVLFITFLAAAAIAACSPKSEEPAKPAAQSAAPAAPATDLFAKAASATPNAGTILKMEQAGIYTYAEVDTGSQKLWLAGGHIDAKVGDKVQWGDYAVMSNFNSKALNRTFEQVLFVNNWGKEGASMAPMAQHGTQPAAGAMGGHPPMAGHPPMGSGGQMPMAGGANSGTVKTATAAAGYSYLEVDQSGKTTWIAVPEMKVKAGDKIAWAPGATMRNFNAKSLNRVFDEIVFAGGAQVVQ